MKRKWIFLIMTLLVTMCGVAGIVTKREKKRAEEEHRHIPYGPYEAFFKRPLDVILSITALIILSPVLLVTAVVVKVKLGSPVIFTQERPGMIDPKTGKEKIFKLYKFRTMTDERDENGNLLPDEQRLTDFGKKLRSTSIDELPELWNILKNDMSVVGNRPLLTTYLDRYSERQRHRHDVKPGLTSLSASKKRNLASWDEKFEDDLRYVDKITFLGDLKIMLDTVKIVLSKKGISSATSTTMEEFFGSQKEEEC